MGMKHRQDAAGDPPIKKGHKIVLTGVKRRVCLGAGVLLLAGMLLLVFRLFHAAPVQQTEQVYDYTVTADTAYRVQLLPNALYPDGWLGEGQLYAQRLVRTLEVTCQAEYGGSEAAAVRGEYAITAVVEGAQEYGDRKTVVYAKQFPLRNGAATAAGDNGASIKESLSVELADYQDFADKAEQILGAKPASKLYIKFEGRFVADTAHGSVEEPFAAVITVPLGSGGGLYEIQKSAPVQTEDGISRTAEAAQAVNTPLLLVALLGLAAALALILTAAVLSREPDEQEAYTQQLDTVMRKYGSRMVRLAQEPQWLMAEAIQVADMDNLVLIAEELKRPIFYTWDAGHKPLNGRFYVWTEQQLYLVAIGRSSTPFGVGQVSASGSTSAETK